MDGSDSEKSRAGGDPPQIEETGAPIPEGAVIAESKESGLEVPAEEPTKVAKQEDTAEPEQDGGGAGGDVAAAGSSKPSYTLRIRNLPSDLELSELEMRLARFGEVVSLQVEDGMVVAKFTRTNDAYQAREKLNGSSPYGEPLQVDFGPQDIEHYNRGKKRAQAAGRGRKEFLDAADAPRAIAGTNKTSRGMRAWQEPPGEGRGTDADADEGRRRKAAEAKTPRVADGAAERPPRPPVAPGLRPPSKAVSRWSPDLTFEEQLEDFMKMPRKGMYNRYLVLGKLPPELRTGEAIWRAMHPVQRDIIQIEMLTCFGKPVAHIALRSATAAAAMHRLCEQMHPGLTVAFAPPRRASTTLWLGNVDDFVPRKELEELLGEYGKVINGMRYLPARTCAFASFSELGDAILARNSLYGLEVQRNQYLNVDFVDEGDNGYTVDGWGAWPGVPPWAAPTPWAPGAAWGAGVARPWGGATPWGARGPQGRENLMQRPGIPAWGALAAQRTARERSPVRMQERNKREHRHRSRTRSHGRRSDREASPPVEKPKKRKRVQEGSPGARPTKAARSGSPDEPPRHAAKGEAKAVAGKAVKVKLYKMGEFCCNVVANYVKGKEAPEPLVPKLQIDQRTKIDHCRLHMERAGPLATVWNFSAADRKDCAAYDALCDYFVEKQRVGLVQTPSYYIYLVPPTEKYLQALSLPSTNYAVGLQIPVKK